LKRSIGERFATDQGNLRAIAVLNNSRSIAGAHAIDFFLIIAIDHARFCARITPRAFRRMQLYGPISPFSPFCVRRTGLCEFHTAKNRAMNGARLHRFDA
jgi:hypothetical protein